MSKEQINYLLALATLLIVWLYFNTFYVNARKNYGGNPFGGIKTVSTLKLPNVPGLPKVPEAPQMADLLKSLPRGQKAPAVPVEIPPVPSEASKTGESSKS